MYQKKKKLKINIRMNNLRQYNLNTNVTLLNSLLLKKLLTKFTLRLKVHTLWIICIKFYTNIKSFNIFFRYIKINMINVS